MFSFQQESKLPCGCPRHRHKKKCRMVHTREINKSVGIDIPISGYDDALINEIVHNFFEYIIILKMYHFQTKLYNTHKISDTYLGTVLEQFDKFMEILQGLNNKQLTTPKIELSITMANDNDIHGIANEFIIYMKGLKGRFDNSLDAIIDEIMYEAEKFKYLLLFK